MRDALQLLDGQRLTVQAAVLRHGRRLAWTGTFQPTILLGQVTSLDGALLTDHLWIAEGRRLAALDLHAGDVVQFSGRVRAYQRRATADPEHRMDYHLAYPTHCMVLARAARTPRQERPAESPQPEIPALPVTNTNQTVALIAQLWREKGEPPSLVKLCDRAPVPPWQVLKSLHNLAKAHTIQFSPTGHVFISRDMEVHTA